MLLRTWNAEELKWTKLNSAHVLCQRCSVNSQLVGPCKGQDSLWWNAVETVPDCCFSHLAFYKSLLIRMQDLSGNQEVWFGTLSFLPSSSLAILSRNVYHVIFSLSFIVFPLVFLAQVCASTTEIKCSHYVSPSFPS